MTTTTTEPVTTDQHAADNHEHLCTPCCPDRSLCGQTSFTHAIGGWVEAEIAAKLVECNVCADLALELWHCPHCGKRLTEDID